MPSFDRAPTAPTPTYPPPPVTVSSDSRRSHSVTPQQGFPNMAAAAAYAGYHMPRNMYPGANGTNAAGENQHQQYAPWHSYPPYGGYHGGPAFPFPSADQAAMAHHQQNGYAQPSFSQQSHLRTSPLPKKDSPDKPGEVLSSNNTPAPSPPQQQSLNEQDLELTEVKPIQTDFHFFVKEYMHKLRDAAAAEVDASLSGKSEDFITKHRQYLVNSNLNCRLMKHWEDMAQEDREDYFLKEENDRKRFMDEDEVASRHCFTLTARQRSPTAIEGSGSNKRPPSASPTDEESPNKKTNVTSSETYFIGN